MDWSVVLHKNQTIILVIKDVIFENFEVGVSGVPILLRLEITVHYIEIRPLSCSPKGSPDYNPYILSTLICCNYIWIPFLYRKPENPFDHFTPPPLYRILVTLYVFFLPCYIPVSPNLVPKKPKVYYFLYKFRSLLCTPILELILI